MLKGISTPSSTFVSKWNEEKNAMTPRERTIKRGVIWVIFSLLMACVLVSLLSLFRRTHHSVADVHASSQAEAPRLDLTTLAGMPQDFLGLRFNEMDSTKLHLNVAKAHLKKPFIVHALYYRPTFVKGTIPNVDVMTSMPAESTTQLVFHFQESQDGQSLEYVREQWVLRTSDSETEYTLKENAWTGIEAYLPILEKKDEAYIVDAAHLALNGFFVYDSTNVKRFRVDLKETKAYPRNANIFINYLVSPGKVYKQPEHDAIMFSIMLLPEKVMPTRLADPRIGYFSTDFINLGIHWNPEEGNTSYRSNNIDAKMKVIQRRRMESNAQGTSTTPIVFYIDPSVPKSLWAFMKEGVEVWQEAFTHMGVKKAIRAVLPLDVDWPQDFHVGDARFSSISFSAYAGVDSKAVGLSIVDPRSGEILASNIVFSTTWSDVWISALNDAVTSRNVDDDDFGTELASSSILAAKDQILSPPLKSSSTSTFHERHSCKHHRLEHDLRKLQILKLLPSMSDAKLRLKVLGKALASAVSHEVGHALGLSHNLGGSTARDPTQLFDRELVKKRGISSSVMDYLPLNVWSNLTVQVSDIEDFLFQNRVGEYDQVAILYGYQPISGEKPGFKHSELTSIASKASYYASDDDAKLSWNGYAQRFDLGDNPIVFYKDRIELVRKLRKHTMQSSVEDKGTWHNLWTTERGLLTMLEDAMEGLARFLGGIKTVHTQKANVVAPNQPIHYVSREDQLDALHGIVDIVKGQNGLYPDDSMFAYYTYVFGTYGVKAADAATAIQDVRNKAVATLLSEDIFKRIIHKGSSAPLSLADYLRAASTSIMQPPATVETILTQKVYVDTVKKFSANNDLRIASIVSNEVTHLKELSKTFVNATTLLPESTQAILRAFISRI